MKRQIKINESSEKQTARGFRSQDLKVEFCCSSRLVVGGDTNQNYGQFPPD